MKKLLPWIVALGLIGGVVYAQQVTLPPPNGGSLLACAYTGNTSPTIVSGNFGWVQCDVHGQVLISNPGGGGSGGGGTVSVAGFAPSGNYANLTATGSSADATLPTNTGSVVAYNTGTTAVSCNLTVGAGSSAVNKDIIQPGSSAGFAVGSNTHISCIDQTGSASNLVVISGGSGLPTGWGGGSGGGAGGSVTQGTNPWLVNPSTGAAWGVGATGSAVPLSAQYIAINSGGNLTGWTGAVTVASGGIAAGALASGAGVDGWDLTQGTKADAAYTSGSGSVVSVLKGIYTSVNAAIPDCGATPCTNKIGNVYMQSQFPPAAVPIQNSTTSAAGTITNLSADASNFNYICGFSIRANATAAATGNSTVSGMAGTPLNFLQWTAPLASGVGVNEQLFQPCQPSSAVNTAIAISPAFPGAGGTVTVSVWGFKKTTSP